jgi:uncharacterized protein YjgD (DUF1641 family)
MLAFTACESDESSGTSEDINLTEGQDTSAVQRREKVKHILYTIPSPMEMVSLIKKSGASFDKSNLNAVENSNNYTTTKSQAINLGVYGADLSYASMFDQNQESIFYLSAAQKLAKSLGVERAIGDEIISRINTNKDNRDSLLAIVSEAYWSLNGYLKEGDREAVSALVIAGGWVEGLYLASQHMTDDNTELKQRIAEQKYSLKDLIDLLNSYPDDALTSVREDLAAIEAVYNAVDINKEKTETSTDETGTMVIGGESSVTIDDETLANVVAKVTEIRNKYIQ